MADPAVAAPSKQFRCAVCGFAVPYEKHATSFNANTGGVEQKHVYLEPVFMVSDPNTTRRLGLVLGGTCVTCNAMCCADEACSVFFGKRFCAPCARQRADVFPPQLLKVASKAFGQDPARPPEAT